MNESQIMYLIVVNGLTLFFIWLDKRKAIKNQYRIPERTFFLLSLLGGALGTYIGMQLFRHKTKQKRFTIGMPLLIIIQLGLIIYFGFIQS